MIERAGLTSDEIKLIIPHQANLRIINAVAQRLSIPEEKVFINIENTEYLRRRRAICFDEARAPAGSARGTTSSWSPSAPD